MRIATWNVNSIRSRLERLTAWLRETGPDAVCLQETKCVDEQFPHEALREVGYQAVVSGQATYNGVAILAKSEPTDVRIGLEDGEPDEPARLISAEVQGVRVLSMYVPNGQVIGADAYAYKLSWLSRLRRRLVKSYDREKPLVLAGDANVILRDSDAADMAPWRNTVLGCEEVRGSYRPLLRWGLTDQVGQTFPDGGVYSFWDYRARMFERDDGLRIDHVLLTLPLVQVCTSAGIDREWRGPDKPGKPSDHTPVWVELDV